MPTQELVLHACYVCAYLLSTSLVAVLSPRGVEDPVALGFTVSAVLSFTCLCMFVSTRH